MNAETHDRVVAGLPFVKTLARRLASSSPALEMDDLVQDGLLGLMDAARRFDEAQGIPFEAFATSRVRGAMVDGLRKKAWPRRLRRIRREVAAAQATLRQELRSEPSPSQLAQRLNLAVEPLLRRMRQIQALEQTVQASAFILGSPENEYVQRDYVHRALRKLTARDRDILTRYYFADATMREISDSLGVNVPRVSQLHARALQRLRRILAL